MKIFKRILLGLVVFIAVVAVLFLLWCTHEELIKTARRIVERFHPRLVLGVSDEVPEGA